MKKIWLWTLSLIVVFSLGFPTGPTLAYPDGYKALFMEPVSGALPEWGSSVALDSNGGIHAAMQFEIKNGSSLTHPIYYVYCAANCSTASSWKWVLLGDTLQYGSNGHPKVALTPKGLPRVMWYTGDETANYYSECNAACTNPASWVRSDKLPYGGVLSDFILDAQGFPHYVYPGSEGPHVMTCTKSCTSASNWSDTPITDPSTWYPIYNLKLAVNTAGLASVIGYLDGGDNIPLVYIACTQSPCDQLADWSGMVNVLNLGDQTAASDADWSLKLDSHGHPRVALYWNATLHYLYSNGDPLQAPTWLSYSLNLPTNDGEYVDLVIDQQDYPHMAFHTIDAANKTDGLGSLVCTSTCQPQSGTAAWQFQTIETASDLDTSDPVPLKYPSCTVSMWSGVGLYPALTLDGGGNPVLTYLARDIQYGPLGSGCPQFYARSSLRIAALSGGVIPPQTGGYKIYLPTVKK